MAAVQRLGHGGEVAADAARQRCADAEHVRNGCDRHLQQARGCGRSRNRSHGSSRMPAADARSAKVRARKAPGDLCTHDIGRDRLGRRRTQSFRERQDRGNDRRGRLTADISEIVVHRVRGDAIGERGKLRRRAQRLPDDRRLRRAASSFTISTARCDTSSWLPASMTPIVSMKAIRARSITAGGALLRSKPAI